VPPREKCNTIRIHRTAVQRVKQKSTRRLIRTNKNIFYFSFMVKFTYVGVFFVFIIGKISFGSEMEFLYCRHFFFSTILRIYECNCELNGSFYKCRI
jgi:hypothetical protein